MGIATPTARITRPYSKVACSYLHRITKGSIMKSFSFNVVLVLYLFSFSSNVKVAAINCFDCLLTKGWLMTSGTWGVDGCNSFTQNMTYNSARNCSIGISANDPEPTHCYTTFESFLGQADFSGVKETRGCHSVPRGKFSISLKLYKNISNEPK